jgi:hypothetical protein
MLCTNKESGLVWPSEGSVGTCAEMVNGMHTFMSFVLVAAKVRIKTRVGCRQTWHDTLSGPVVQQLTFV